MPERAIVPKLRASSSLLIPIPVSRMWILPVLPPSSRSTRIVMLVSPPERTLRSVKETMRSFSKASFAFDSSSRKKTSL